MLKKILIINFGQIEKEVIDRISSTIQKTFGIKTEFFDQMPIPWTAKKANQLKASDFLVSEREILENNQADAVLGVTKKDLFMPDLNFVFGLASPRDQVVVVSLARLSDDNKKLFFERIRKEAIHETGHLFGLDHCEDKLCAMSFSKNLWDVDFKKIKLCSNCQKLARENVKRIS